MITGVGTDIVEIGKIRKHARRDDFLKKVFTEKEITYCKSKESFEKHLATTFAAKEAIFKALGTGWLDGKEIEIIRGKSGRPKAILNGTLKKENADSEIMISLSYSKDSAIAFAIIKKEKR